MHMTWIGWMVGGTVLLFFIVMSVLASQLSRSVSSSLTGRRDTGPSYKALAVSWAALEAGREQGSRGPSECSSSRLSTPLRSPLTPAQHLAEPEPGRAALPEAEFDQPALPDEHVGRKLAAVSARHHPFDAFDDRRAGAPVVLELLSTVIDGDVRPVANVLVVCAFIGVLEPSSAADVVDKDRLEAGLASLHILEALLQGVPASMRSPLLPASV